MSNTKILETFTDEANGLQAFIVLSHYGFGYNVSLKDTDADAFYPTVQVFKTIEEARNAAQKAVHES